MKLHIPLGIIYSSALWDDHYMLLPVEDDGFIRCLLELPRAKRIKIYSRIKESLENEKIYPIQDIE